LLASSPAVEFIFTWPGLGYQFVQAAKMFDQPVVLAIVIVMTAVTLIANLLADLTAAYIDPRVKLG